MKISGRTVILWYLAITLSALHLWNASAWAQSSYFISRGCSACHVAPVATTCNGCHGHGAHPSSAKTSVNVAGTTNKSSYAPGETVTVTITGGYRTGWVRAVLYDQNRAELARSTGNSSGMGSSTTFPATLSAPAPATAGTYTWKVAWYGHRDDSSGAAFGSGWTLDPNNPDHGAEIVNLAPFTVAAATPPTPTIASVAPNTLAQGASNQTVTIAGTNLTGVTVRFSNTGITGGTPTITATSVRLPVSVAAAAATGAGTVTVTSASGSASSPFNVTAAAIPAPTIGSVTPSSLVQGAVNQTVTIAGANLLGARVSFSNPGVTAGTATISTTTITLPVSVAATATAGTGTLTVTTASGSASSPFTVASAAIPAPAIGAVTPNTLVQGTVNQTVTITGANLGGARVSFSNSGVSGGTATVTATSISLPVTVAANAATGSGSVTVTTAGGSASSAFGVTPRASVPALTVSALSDGSYTNNATLNISGNVTATAGIQSVTVNTQPVPVLPDGTFSTALTLAVGANTVTIVATDNSGGQKSDSRTIVYDPVAPLLTVTMPADNSSRTTSFVTVSGTVNETSTVTVTDFTGTPQYATMSGNNFSATVNLAPGVNTVGIVATDLAGNTSSAKRTITYDTSKLTLSVTNPPQDLTTNLPTLVVTGTVTNSSKEITVKITVAGQTYTHLVTTGIFNQRLTFAEPKLYPITVTARDAAGRTSTVTRNVIYRPATREDEDEDDDKGTDVVTTHPFGWTNPRDSHDDYVERNGVVGCVGCHSIDPASKGRTRSCFNCHGQEWTPPTTGGTTTGGTTTHPFGWTDPRRSHANYVESNGVDGCTGCHNLDPASKGQATSCFNCHGQEWATPATGGTTTHPFGWSNPRDSHDDYVDRNGVDGCTGCHRLDAASRGQTMSCLNCHGQEWETPTTGGTTTGGTTTHPFGWSDPRRSHTDYVEDNGVDGCTGCHYLDSTSRGQPMSCYNCHGKEW